MKSEDDPTETQKLSEEVNKDLAAGEGGKHFEAEIDALHSLDARTAVPDPDIPRQLHVFCRDFKQALNEQLHGSGMRCIRMTPDGRGEGFAMAFVDRQGRPFDVSYSFDEGMAAAARGEMGREMLSEVAAKLMNARARYFARMH